MDNVYKPKTSAMHRSRGYCCKSACLHCPYGFTLDKHGLKFKAIDSMELQKASAILIESRPKGVAALLLQEAFTPKKMLKITEENRELFSFILLKDYVCGLFYKNNQDIQTFLLPDFSEQGLDKDIIFDFFKKTSSQA